MLHLMCTGGLWPTFVVKRVVDRMSLMGCQLPIQGCVLYDRTVAVSPLTHTLFSTGQNLQGQGLFPQGQGKAKDLTVKVKAKAKAKDLACKAKDFLSVHQSVV